MALAWIEQDPTDPDPRAFRIEIGANRFWRVAVGPDRRQTVDGVELLADPVWVSELHGPLPAEAMGRAQFQLPDAALSDEAEAIQLMSYADAERNGPAVSDIAPLSPALRVLPPIRGPQPGNGAELPDFQPAPIPMSRGPVYARAHTAPEPVPMRWRTRPQMPQSNAMFLGALTGAASGLAAAIGPLLSQIGPVLLQALPSISGIVGGAAPVVGQLLGALLPGQGGQQAREAGQALGGLSNEQLRRDISALTEILCETQRAPAAATAPAAPSAPAPAAAPASGSASLMRMRAKSRAAARRGSWQPLARSSTRSRAMIIDGGIVTGALAGQVLGPILQNVLTPETVQQILQMPNQHMQTIFNAMRDAARLGIESHEQDLRHLRELNPGVDDAALDQLLASMSLSLSAHDPGADWVRAASVSLSLPEIRTLPVAGREISLHAQGQRLAFPLSVTLPTLSDGRTPKLRDARVQLQVKHAQTLEILHHATLAIGTVEGSGRLPRVPEIPADVSATLPSDSDLIFCFTLIWPNAQGALRGAPIQHRGRIAPGMIFDRLDPGAEEVALADRAKFGDYWHKIWAGRFADGAKSYDLETRYLYVIPPEARDTHRRIETTLAEQPVESSIARMQARLRSGMELSPAALSRLGTMLDPSGEALPTRAQAALHAPEFSQALNRAGHARLTFRGQIGDPFEVFAYPVMGLDTCVFRTPSEIDPHGQVLAMGEARFRLPVPRRLALRVGSLGTGGTAGRALGDGTWIAQTDVALARSDLVATQSRRARPHSRRARHVA